MTFRPFLALPFALAAAACGGGGVTPILDGPPSAAFEADLAACRTLARDQRQLDAETAGAAVLGAGIGAALGAADETATAAEGLVAGALAGGVASAVDVHERRDSIVLECLRGRGHRVVG